jgi:hypothetical protein
MNATPAQISAITKKNLPSEEALGADRIVPIVVVIFVVPGVQLRNARLYPKGKSSSTADSMVTGPAAIIQPAGRLDVDAILFVPRQMRITRDRRSNKFNRCNRLERY